MGVTRNSETDEVHPLKKTSITEKLTELLPLLVVIFCGIQPVLDVMGYWQVTLEISNGITLLIRMGLLCGSLLLGFILSDRKWVYWGMAGVLGILVLGHIAACMQVGYADPVTDLADNLRTFSLPLNTICFITFLRKNDQVYPAIKKGMLLVLGIILLVQILATVTGTDPHTYGNKEIGVLGWFFWANTQSGVLCILAPMAIAWALNRWKDRVIPVFGITLVSLGMLFLLATRLAYVGLAVAGVGLALSLVIVDRRRIKQAAAILLCAAFFVALYPLSPMVANQRAVAANAVLKQEAADQILEERGLDEENVDLDALEEIYAPYLSGMMQRFGVERVAQVYNYTTDISIVGDVRLEKLRFCAMLLEDSPGLSQLFGMELGRMRETVTLLEDGEYIQETEVYDAENDFHGCYYLNGAVGLALAVLFLGYFLLRTLRALVLDFKSYFTVDLAALGIAYCCSVAHIYFTNSMLRRQNGSVYLALTLALAWYLTQKRFSGKRSGVRSHGRQG